jgi:hypothetical protein
MTVNPEAIRVKMHRTALMQNCRDLHTMRASIDARTESGACQPENKHGALASVLFRLNQITRFAISKEAGSTPGANDATPWAH